MKTKKTATQVKVENYSKVVRELGNTSNRSHHKHVLSVGDLKKLLANIDDDDMPVFLEVFSDAYCAQEIPLYAVTTTSSSSPETDLTYEVLVLQSIEDDSFYKEWREEDHGSWSDDVLNRSK